VFSPFLMTSFVLLPAGPDPAHAAAPVAQKRLCLRRPGVQPELAGHRAGLRVFYAFAAFCCLSSMVYIINDWHDRASDALHPTKRKRPLASGAVAVPVALVLAGCCWSPACCWRRATVPCWRCWRPMWC
jgi:hypothetical protein